MKRLQLCLSMEAKIILEEEKLAFFRKNHANATYGFITNKIFNFFSADILAKRIDWEAVRRAPEYDNIIGNYKNIKPTALTLSDNTLDLMREIRNELNTLLDMPRTVYNSYVIRIVLKAFKMRANKINISKVQAE